MQTKDCDGVQESKAAGNAVRSRRDMQHSAKAAAKDDPLASKEFHRAANYQPSDGH